MVEAVKAYRKRVPLLVLVTAAAAIDRAQVAMHGHPAGTGSIPRLTHHRQADRRGRGVVLVAVLAGNGKIVQETAGVELLATQDAAYLVP
jgi:hypothetical protein